MLHQQPDPLADLRLAAARFVLGLLQSWDLPPLAERALVAGHYVDALAELAGCNEPIMSDCDPLFRRALQELGISMPSRVDAAWQLTRECARQIVDGEVRPVDALTALRDVTGTVADILPDKTHVGDGLDAAELIGIYWSYDEPDEVYIASADRVLHDERARQDWLDAAARCEAQRWLERHSAR